MRMMMRRNHGVGIAANQVGEADRLIVIEDVARANANTTLRQLAERRRVPVEYYGLANPEVDECSDQQSLWFEGCLSIPYYTAMVPRADSVRVSGWNVGTGKPCVFTATGWHARIIQHEIDHLNGVLYVDRMLPKTLMTKTEHKARYGSMDGAALRRSFQLGGDVTL